MEAIQAATIVPARVMKLDGELGTLEAGKRADLILVDGNPLENIHNHPEREAGDRWRRCVQQRVAVEERGV